LPLKSRKEDSGDDIAAFLNFHCRQRAGRKIQAMISPLFLLSIAAREQGGRKKYAPENVEKVVWGIRCRPQAISRSLMPAGCVGRDGK
jgi:hypothetical protein